MGSPMAMTTHAAILRPLANFPPTLWGSTFASFSFPHSEFERYTQQVEVLKEDVKIMLKASANDPIENIVFINLLSRLGLSYHFEEVIQDQLALIFSALPTLLQNNDHYSLSATSTLFRVLRQHGYNMPCDVFEKFKDDSTGKFKEVMSMDVKGVLDLYEAAHVSFHGENILEEAITFARAKLESLTSGENPAHLEKLIKNALNRPHHKGIPRIETKKFISFYQEDESTRNETLVRFAKIDFNRVQLLHQQELSILSRWWEELNFSKEFPYARDRIVEIYFWANGMHFEPKYAVSRIMVTKYTMLVSVVDDTYDAYATFEELQSFTAAFNRCSVDAMDELKADYLKILYKALLDFFDETEEWLSREGRSSHGAYYAKEAFKELVRAYDTEAKWSNEGYVPSFDEYISNGYTTSAYGVLMGSSFLGAEKAGVKEYEWLRSNPRIIRAGKMIGRLMNDISGHEDEQERGDCASGVECYMKEYNVSKEIAVKEIQKIDKNGWKDMNEESMRGSVDVPMHLINIFVNLIRVTDVIYEEDDAYTIPLSLKDEVIALFMENIAS